MAGQIRMTPEQMNSRASEVRGQRDAFEEVISKMQNIINELLTEWEGAASASYSQQFNDLKPSFDNMKQLLDDMATQLDKTAEAVKALDEEIASKFGVQ